MRPLRVMWDGTPLLLRSAGVKNYVYHCAVSLRRLAGAREVRVYPMLDQIPRLDHESSGMPFLSTAARLALLHFVNLPHNPAIDWVCRNSDLFHASQQSKTPPRKARLTATIHDLTCWRMPQFHTAANAAGALRHAEAVWRRAHGLIAVSEATRRDAIEILRLPPERIEVVYSGVSDAFFTATSESVARAKAHLGIIRPYVLFVGTIEPRKNIDVALDAWQLLPRDIREEFDFVLAGPAGWGNQKTLNRLRSGIAGVRHLGYVSEEDLPGLNAGATALVYPSLYEGFGFPVAQAMAAGVPVITSNVSALPEIAGDAGILVEPGSEDQIRSALERMLTSPSVRQALSERGKEIARRYTWESTAEKTWQFFERVYRQGTVK